MTKCDFLSNKISLKLKEGKMNINSPLLKAELWTKLKTIRDDKNTPLVYAKWCSQVMEYLELLSNDE